MEAKGERKKNKPMLYYWAFIGLFIGFTIWLSTDEIFASVISGIVMAVALAWAATKPGLD
jgi:hypothetical protein